MDDEVLIASVEKHPFLFNKQLSAFKNTEKKQEAWQKISKELNAPGMESSKSVYWKCNLILLIS